VVLPHHLNFFYIYFIKKNKILKEKNGEVFFVSLFLCLFVMLHRCLGLMFVDDN
jgi:hypothetical protein